MFYILSLLYYSFHGAFLLFPCFMLVIAYHCVINHTRTSIWAHCISFCLGDLSNPDVPAWQRCTDRAPILSLSSN